MSESNDSQLAWVSAIDVVDYNSAVICVVAWCRVATISLQPQSSSRPHAADCNHELMAVISAANPLSLLPKPPREGNNIALHDGKDEYCTALVVSRECVSSSPPISCGMRDFHCRLQSITTMSPHRFIY